MKTDLFENVKKYMFENNMLGANTLGNEESAVVVGVSGGADSVCLLRLLVQLRDETGGLYIKAVHINHGIRGEEADSDQHFVEELCKELQVDCQVYFRDIPSMARENHLTEEEAGRIFRYECFEEEALKLSNGRNVKIAVAHNRDDLAETVLYNMIRGSSLFGLAGIQPVRGRIIRPLLMTDRAAIEQYLKEVAQDFRTDSTNLMTEYSRNKIRNVIMPILKEINEGATDHITDIALDARQLKKDVENEIENLYYSDDHSASVKVETLRHLGSLSQGELVLGMIEACCGKRKDITRDHISSVIQLSEKESGKSVDLPYSLRAERIYERIEIRTVSGEGQSETGITDSIGTIEITTFPYTRDLEISKKEYTKMIDYDKIKFVLTLRTAEKDDYIVISSSGGRKKLSRFFTDNKIERSKRSKILVVADGNEIVWVVGYRLSESYKVTPETRTVGQITFIEPE